MSVDDVGPRPTRPETRKLMARKAKAAPPARPAAAEPAVPSDPIDSFIERGQLAPAIAHLLPALEQKARQGDRVCGLAARLLRISPMAEAAAPQPPDALAATLERLVALIARQEDQIRTLRTLIEDEL